jgi:bacterial/archaeal transporter family protein
LKDCSSVSWFTWALLSAFFAGLTAVLAKIGVAGIDSTLATAIRTTVILVFTWILFFALSPARNLKALDGRNWLFLVLSGLATGLSWICYFRALQLGEASRVAPIDKLSVVFALVFAALLLHEKLTWQHWTGAILILAGAAILAIKT